MEANSDVENKKDSVDETPPAAPAVTAATFQCTPCGKTFSSSASFTLHCKRKSHMAKGLTPISPETPSANVDGD